jgi:hypothetical protein
LRRIIREQLESDRRAIVVLGNTSTGPVYVVAYDKDVLERKLRGETPWDNYESGTKDYYGVIAGLSLKKTDEYGECNGAWQVSTSVSNEKGWGTKVYLAAFEWLRNISSDRYSVSAAAEGMWKSLARSGVIEPEPFDDYRDPKTPPTSDDCRVFKLRDPVLNSSFKLVGSIPSEVSQLIKAGEDHLDEFSRAGVGKLAMQMALRTGLGDLFINVYDG